MNNETLKSNKKTSKKSTIFFVFLTFIYLIFEISFRMDLLNATATVKDFLEVESIELTGRFLASFGFLLFILSNISFKKISSKIIMYPLIGSLSFFGFYQAQNVVIDNLGEHFTPKEKTKMSLLLTDKELLYFEKISYNDLFFTKKDNESKIFLSMYPSLRYNDSKHNKALKLMKKDLINLNAHTKYNSNKEHLVSILKTEINTLRNVFDYYKGVSNTYPSKKLFTEKDAVNLYLMTTESFSGHYQKVGNFHLERKKEFRGIQKLNLERYKGYIDSYKTLSEKEFNLAVKNIDTFEYFPNSSFIDLINYRVYHNATADNGRTYMISGVTFFSHPEVHDAAIGDIIDYLYKNNFTLDLNNNNCSISESNEFDLTIDLNGDKRSFNKFLTKEESRKKFEKAYFDIFKKDFESEDDFYSIDCKLSYSNYKRKYQPFFNKVVDNNPFLKSSIYPMNQTRKQLKKITPEMVNNNPMLKRVAVNVMHDIFYKSKKKTLNSLFVGKLEGKYMDFYNTLDLTSAEKFIRSINKFLVEIERDIFYNKVKEKGFNLDFLRNKKVIVNVDQFYEIPQIKNQIFKKYPFLINNNKVILYPSKIKGYNEKEFINYLANKEIKQYLSILKNPILLNDGNKYEELGNNIAKSFVAIPLVLLISTFMIILSIVNILLKLAGLLNINKKVIITIKTTLISMIIILPILTTNKYADNKLVQENNIYMKTSTNWLLNTQKGLNLITFKNKTIEKGYNFIKYTSYLLAYEYNKIQNKDNKNLKIKINHDKIKFKY